MTHMPNPSGFRTHTLPPGAPAAMLAARLVRDSIDFNYHYDGQYHFVVPVKHYARMLHILREIEE